MISKILDQGLGNCSPQAKSSLPSVFENTVLLGHSTFIHLFIIYDCFHATATGLDGCDRDHITHKT